MNAMLLLLVSEKMKAHEKSDVHNIIIIKAIRAVLLTKDSL